MKINNFIKTTIVKCKFNFKLILTYLYKTGIIVYSQYLSKIGNLSKREK